MELNPEMLPNEYEVSLPRGTRRSNALEGKQFVVDLGGRHLFLAQGRFEFGDHGGRTAEKELAFDQPLGEVLAN